MRNGLLLVKSTLRTSILVSNTILQLKKPGLLVEMVDCITSTTNRKDPEAYCNVRKKVLCIYTRHMKQLKEFQVAKVGTIWGGKKDKVVLDYITKYKVMSPYWYKKWLNK